MMKTLDMVVAIIERDGKILPAQRPPRADQPDMWEFAGGKVGPGESQSEALIRELCEKLDVEAVMGRYIASHQREVSGRLIHLHTWHVPPFQRELKAFEHQDIVRCSPEKALRYPLAPTDIPLLKAFIPLHAARPADSR